MPKQARPDVRRVAADVLSEALETKSPVGANLERARGSLTPLDRGLLYELVLGTLRQLRLVDFVLETVAARPRSKVDQNILPALRLAIYQLLFLDRIPSHAAVHAAVEEIKRRSHRGAAGFGNAILRKVAKRRSPDLWKADTGDGIEDLAIQTSYPTFLVRRWLDRFGYEKAVPALEAGNRRAGYQLTSMIDRDVLALELAGDGVETQPTELTTHGIEVLAGDPRRTAGFEEGRFYIQDQASQAAAMIPSPVSGERVLDVAAAPGGKGFALLAVEPKVVLTASDLSLARTLQLRANQKRLQLGFGVAVSAGEQPSFKKNFDRVIVDLPCSGTGTFARHPELKWRVSPREMGRLAEQSLEILTASADLVGVGGRLCAITCSLEHEENEDVIAEFRERRPDFELEELDLPSNLAPFVAGPGLWRVLPSERHDGFTVHVLTKR